MKSNTSPTALLRRGGLRKPTQPSRGGGQGGVIRLRDHAVPGRHLHAGLPDLGMTDVRDHLVVGREVRSPGAVLSRAHYGNRP